MNSNNSEEVFSQVDAQDAIMAKAREDELRHQPLRRRDITAFSVPPTKKQKQDPVKVARESEKIAAQFESPEEVEHIEEEAREATKPKVRAAKQVVIQTSNKEPLPPAIKEKIAKPLDKNKKDQHVPPVSSDANRRLRIQADVKATSLRLASLWDSALFPASKNTESKARYLWPNYSGMHHDATLVKLDFIIDYLNNLLLIGDEPTTLARYKLIFAYESQASEMMGNMAEYAAVEAEDLAQIELQNVSATSKPYVFQQCAFGERAPLNKVRREKQKLLANADIRGALSRPIRPLAQLGRKRSLSLDRDSTLTRSGDSDEDDNAANPEQKKPSKVPIDQFKMTAEQLGKILPTPKTIYQQMSTTQYELEHPHFMTPIHQRLLIGKLNNLLFVHTNAELARFRLDDVACNVFGLDKLNPSSWSRAYITRLAVQMSTYVHALLFRITTKAVAEFVYVYDTEKAEKLQTSLYNRRLRAINHQVEMLMRFLLLQIEAFQCGQRPTVPDRPSILSMAVSAPLLLDENVYANQTPLQRMIRRLVEECQANGYRRRNGAIYKEVVTPDGFRANAFERLMDIKDFVWRMPDMNFDVANWKDATSSAYINEAVIRQLSSQRAPEYFPDITRQQFVWSFKNGIYDGHQDRFWRYDSEEIMTNSDSPYMRVESSARYIDKEFDEKTLMSPEAIANPRLIVIDPVNRIFKAQKLSEEVQDWVWAFTGRLYFPNRMLDAWQVVFWLKGVAGTGKSTFAAAVKAPYDPADVGYLQNNIEVQFGLEPMLEKLLLVAPDVKANFSLDAALFQVMVSGDPMSISRKGLVAVTIHQFPTPQLYLSNVFPNWVDSSGSIQRRIMALLMEFPVPDAMKDSKLDAAMLAQLDALVVRACRSYKQKLALVGSADVWNFVPNEFRVARDEVSRQTAELVRFFEEFLVVSATETEATDFVDVSDLEYLYYKKKQLVGIINEKNDNFQTKLARDISSFHNLHVQRHQTTHALVIFGCRLRLKSAIALRQDANWLPTSSKYYTDEDTANMKKQPGNAVANAEIGMSDLV